MSLESYRRKRDFDRTPEPRGYTSTGEDRWRFVVQKHDASRLHYDLRLELGGVLLSWAIPKGPSLDDAQKRLAVQVEDHPLEYLEFEGVIPAHEYGGGTVMVWDRGHWKPRQDALAEYEVGELKFHLSGEKLQGGFMLKRLDRNEQNQWLLIKEKDSAVREAADFDVLAEMPNSVLTHRSMEEIAADRTSIWTPVSDGEPLAFDPRAYPQAQPSFMPPTLRPSLPTACRQPPSGDLWIHEIKYDGYRMLCHFEGGQVRFQSRNAKDWSSQLPSLCRQLAHMPCENAILDGEIVVLNEQGQSDFQALQNRIGSGLDVELRYYVFDLLYLNGYSLAPCRLSGRKELLSRLVEKSQAPRLHFVEHLSGDGALIFSQACQLGAEGIVSKRMDKRYTEGRSEFWRKTKCLQSREFVVGGFTPPTSSRRGFGAILLGLPTDDGRLHFLGKVGTGFSHDSLIRLREKLDNLLTNRSPFDNLTRRQADKGTRWVEPKIVAEIEFGGWTGDELIRFGSFKGLREDTQWNDLEPYTSRRIADHPVPAGHQMPPACDIQAVPELGIPDELSEVRISSPDRKIYPDMGITKLGLATYYAQMGRTILPHIQGRPLSILRCPGGLAETCFFQKRAPHGLSHSVERVTLPTGDGEGTFLIVNDVVGLLSLVQFGAVELHVSNARADDYEHPDRIVFDLDPDVHVAWPAVRKAAHEVRCRLVEKGYKPVVKTTGGRGLHVMLRLDSGMSWEQTREFSKQIAAELAEESPRLYTTSAAKEARKGRIYLDVQRNIRGATTVAAYSTRANRQATVAVPISWDELESMTGGDAFGIQATMKRVAEGGDPWNPRKPTGTGPGGE